MLILVTYDVNTEDKSGKKRLRQVAKICMQYGQRVQNSVFECTIDATTYVRLKTQLSRLIDSESDSLRFYHLGNDYKCKVEHFGKSILVQQDSIMIL